MNKQLKVYIAGPISYIDNENEGAFRQMQHTLEEFGFETIIPHDLFTSGEKMLFKHIDFMIRCVPALMSADYVVTLENWHNSTGATQEKKIADMFGIGVIHYSNVMAWIRKNNFQKVEI